VSRDVGSIPPGPRDRGLRRDPALVPLSRDHHQALVQALALRRGASAPVAAAARTAEEFLAFRREELLGHFEDEEQVLLPAARDAAAPAAERMLTEHTGIHRAAGELAEALRAGRDPRPHMEDLGRRLHDHVRFEERVLFMEIQAALPPDRLAALGAALEKRRSERGAPGCRVPGRGGA
jgi:hypothetical protein